MSLPLRTATEDVSTRGERNKDVTNTHRVVVQQITHPSNLTFTTQVIHPQQRETKKGSRTRGDAVCAVVVLCFPPYPNTPSKFESAPVQRICNFEPSHSDRHTRTVTHNATYYIHVGKFERAEPVPH